MLLKINGIVRIGEKLVKLDLMLSKELSPSMALIRRKKTQLGKT